MAAAAVTISINDYDKAGRASERAGVLKLQRLHAAENGAPDTTMRLGLVSCLQAIDCTPIYRPATVLFYSLLVKELLYTPFIQITLSTDS